MKTFVSDRRQKPRGSDRRRSPRNQARYEAQLRADLALLDAQVGAGSMEHPLTFFGHTNDLSATGLSLVVPSVRIDEQYCVEEGRTLRVLLDLPTAPIEIEATPVRCLPLDEERPERGYIIGAQIRGMSDDQRARYNQYLGTLRLKEKVSKN